MRAPLFLGFTLASLTLFCSACDPPIVGFWESDRKLSNGKRNQMSIESDFTGEAVIYATPTSDLNQWEKFSFDLIWEDEVEEFDIKLTCRSGACEDADFIMECAVIDEGKDVVDKAQCTASKSWSKYPFDWQRNDD